MKRRLMALLLAGSVAAAFPTAALAGEAWCDVDPPVTVFVDGRPVTVDVVLSLPRESVSLAHTASVTGSVSGSTVTVTLAGPATAFGARAEIRRLGLTEGDPGRVYAAGETVTFTFRNVTP